MNKKFSLQRHKAQLETGALISTHTEAGTMVLEQIKLLTDNGIAPDRILIGHLDRRLDVDYHLRIADTGVYMGFDQIGKTKYASEADRIAMLRCLIDRGHAKPDHAVDGHCPQVLFAGLWRQVPASNTCWMYFLPLVLESGHLASDS